MSGAITAALSGLLHRLRPASFRGVPFGVLGAGKDLGRRVITHRFPLRDTVQHEDLGRRERSLTIDGFLVGVDLASRVQRLEAALEQAGPGRLVHPHYGSLDVVVTGAKVTTAAARDLATVSITCELYDSADPQPAGLVNGASLVDRLGLGAIAALVDEYGGLLTLDGLQDFVVDQLGTALGGLGTSLSEVAAAYGLVTQVRGAVAALASWPGSGRRDGSGAAVQTAVAAFGGTEQRPDALLRLAALGVPQPPAAPAGTTPGRQAAAANAEALDALVRGTAAVEAARSGAAVAWDSRDQALAYRDQVAEALDAAGDQAADLGWERSWRAMTDLRAAWVAHVTATAAPLPRLARVTPAATTSSILLAYQLDGDRLATLIGRAADIVRRNAAEHPGFLPGGRPLEVLRDG